MKEFINHNEQENDPDLIKLFEKYGYEDVRIADSKNFNDILYATKDGRECFIKKYNSRHGIDEKTREKANTEMLCYQNLPKEILIETIEVNSDERYLVLKKEELEDIEKDKEFVEKFTDIGLNEFPAIDASFLPETDWSYYENIFKYLKEIEDAGFIDNADDVIGLFESNKKLIENSKQIFSHQDFGPPNVKKINGKYKVLDFEFSRRDNAMYDMACVYIDVKDNEELKSFFDDKIKNSHLYNHILLDLMVIRRATVVMNARLSKLHTKEDRYFSICKNAFKWAVNDLLNKG